MSVRMFADVRECPRTFAEVREPPRSGYFTKKVLGTVRNLDNPQIVFDSLWNIQTQFWVFPLFGRETLRTCPKTLIACRSLPSIPFQPSTLYFFDNQAKLQGTLYTQILNQIRFYGVTFAFTCLPTM